MKAEWTQSIIMDPMAWSVGISTYFVALDRSPIYTNANGDISAVYSLSFITIHSFSLYLLSVNFLVNLYVAINTFLCRCSCVEMWVFKQDGNKWNPGWTLAGLHLSCLISVRCFHRVVFGKGSTCRPTDTLQPLQMDRKHLNLEWQHIIKRKYLKDSPKPKMPAKIAKIELLIVGVIGWCHTF